MTPTYNRLPLLRQAIRSVLDQSVRDLELIVVDDGSTDGTAEYVRSLPDPRVRLVSVDHSGSPAVARNAGARRASGEWLAFLDHDDVWAPGKLAAQLWTLAAQPDAGWCYTRLLRIDRGGRSLGPFDDSVPFGGAGLLAALDLPPAITTSAVVVRRSLFDQVGGFDPWITGCEDLDLWVRLRAVGAPVRVDAPLTWHRESDGRLSRDWRLMDRAGLRLYRKIHRNSRSAAARRECRKLLVRLGLRYGRRLLKAAITAVRLVPGTTASGSTLPRGGAPGRRRLQ